MSVYHTNDTRSLFKTTTRKPAEWEEVKNIVAGDDQAAALKAMPVVRLSPEDEPHHDLFPDAENRVEYVVIHRGRVFYVNTEGATYARYAALIANMTPADFTTPAPAPEKIDRKTMKVIANEIDRLSDEHDQAIQRLTENYRFKIAAVYEANGTTREEFERRWHQLGGKL